MTQAEIDSNGGGDGDIDNTATADSDQTGPDTDDASVPVAQSPALNIMKDVDDVAGGTRSGGGCGRRRDQLHDHGCEHRQHDADGRDGDRSECGCGARSCAAPTWSATTTALLDVGETWTYTATHTVTQADIDTNGGGDGDIDNTATADSDQTGPDTADASVPVAQTPALNITKVVHDVDGDTTAPVADAAGDVVNYTITVANTGNTTLTGVVVTDPYRMRRLDRARRRRGWRQRRPARCRRDLDATRRAHTVTQAEIDSNGGGDGDIDNTATADSTETGPDTADASVPVAQNPALNIVEGRYAWPAAPLVRMRPGT